jgi:4-hydroxy-tetrahydrodipicolinate reductase
MTRVGVVGATGKMGRVVAAAVFDDPDVELVAAVARSADGTPLDAVIGRTGAGITISNRLDVLTDAKVDVAIDFTHPDAVMDNARWYLAHRVHAVIGTTGISPTDLDELRGHSASSGTNVVVSPDFSPTGVVMLHIAKIAARYLDELELVEIHPPTKAEAPSGTTMNTARELAKIWKPKVPSQSREIVDGVRGGMVAGIPVHSIRLSGAPGAEEVRFAHRGDTLVIRATSHQREGYAAGVLLAVKAVSSRPGLTYGLEPLLGFDTGDEVAGPT